MMAKALAQNGAHRVFVLGRRMEKLEEVAKEGVRYFHGVERHFLTQIY
jgi:NAD(P)-dependent dehydrogenase (short-subunit alcohol dehydrogenase family)